MSRLNGRSISWLKTMWLAAFVGAGLLIGTPVQRALGQADDDDRPAVRPIPEGGGQPSDGFGPRPGDRTGPRGERGDRRRCPNRFGESGPSGPGGFNGPRPRGGGRVWEHLSEEKREKVLDFLAEHFPMRYEELMRVQETDPELFKRHISRAAPEMLRMLNQSEDDPEMFELTMQEQENRFRMRRLLRRYNSAEDEADKVALEEDIRELVEGQFDIQQKRMEQEIEHLDHRMDELRRRLEDRATDRDNWIEQHLEKLLSGEFRQRRGDGPRGKGPRQRDSLRRRDGAGEGDGLREGSGLHEGDGPRKGRRRGPDSKRRGSDSKRRRGNDD